MVDQASVNRPVARDTKALQVTILMSMERLKSQRIYSGISSQYTVF